ncbi:hypothetical protein ACIQU4_18325 [Streptomyces sp. NPDC090741]|uniref:hypothetical protein n=1 Tax=Streptomyces sp. NPDC090741 TaxID=3365967 RepID=UPI00380DF83A
MSTPPQNSFRITSAPNISYAKWDAERFETTSTSWTDVPGASINLSLGQGAPSYGALFVATFSAEALSSDQGGDGQGVLYATVFFGDQQAEPLSNNHRFITARGNPEWSSHTLIRVVRFEPEFAERKVNAQVKLHVSDRDMGGVQNWVLKIERYNL